MTHSTPDRLHGVHSLSPGGTTQRIRRSRQATHATEALWRGFAALSFAELDSTEGCPNRPRFEDGVALECCFVAVMLTFLGSTVIAFYTLQFLVEPRSAKFYAD
jgi:hypothetical protein